MEALLIQSLAKSCVKNLSKGRRRLMGCLLLYFAMLLLSSSQLPFCASDDRLTLGDSISVNQTLVSDGGAFALGFFSLSNSSTSLYVGICYASIPSKTIIWIANREKPLADSSGVLKLLNDSDIVLLDSKGNIYWSSNVSTRGLSGNSTVAVLLNTGNFVLRQGDGSTLWQSFDHPTDTFLPGMKLQYDYKTGFTQHLTSWKDSLDASPGNFSFGVDPITTLQLFTWRGQEPYWRSSAWYGNLFSSARPTNSGYVSYLTFIANEEEIYMTFSVADGSAMTRFTLDPMGQIKLLGWDQSSKNWSILSSWPLNRCEVYGLCGPFGYYDNTESVRTCKCLEGFQPKVQTDWSSGNFSGGCVREKNLECGGGDGFLRLTGMKVPDRFVFLQNRSMSECEAECVGNCSCAAYAYANLNSGSSNVSRCLVWFEDLIDTEQLGSTDKQLGNTGEDLYLRLAASQLGDRKKTKIIVILLPIAVAILLIACICTVWKCRDKIKGSRKKKNKVRLINGLSSSTEFPKEFSASSGTGEGKSGEGPELPLFTFDSIVVATDNFSDLNKLGQGGFGKVYKGKLPEGQEIAVKRLSRGSGQGLVEFKNEVGLIAKLQHRNLVRLLGCCIHGEEKILLYEHMANKSLDAFLFDPKKKGLLDWGKRFNIIKGIARGLLYLHQDSRLRIIHRDLKASNILLDEEMNPKISDFGMARIFGGNQNEANTLRVVGTYGYMSPEYVMEGLFSVKSDVYSFGVLLLEIMCSSRNSSFHLTMNYPNLLSYAWNSWNEGKAMDIVDPSISGSCSLHEVQRCIHVGLLCVQYQPNDRPPMSSVVFMLENENATFLTPKEPVCTAVRNVYESDPPIHIIEAMSTNNVTITQVEGR